MAWPVSSVGMDGPAKRRKRIGRMLELILPSRTRSRRVVVLLGAIAVLSLMDLRFTLLAHQIGGFVEANPVFCGLVNSPLLMTLCKAVALALGLTILLIYRRRGIVELACWGLLGAYVALNFLWVWYFRLALVFTRGFLLHVGK